MVFGTMYAEGYEKDGGDENRMCGRDGLEKRCMVVYERKEEGADDSKGCLAKETR